jgi:hypothetical protein
VEFIIWASRVVAMKQWSAVYGPLKAEKRAFYGPILEGWDFENIIFMEV